MKCLAVLLLLVVCLHLTTTLQAQKISLSVKDAPLESVFKQIRTQTNYNFLYASQLIEQAPKVTLEVTNANVEEVLDQIFKGTKLQYEITDRTIVISANKWLSPKNKLALLPNKSEGLKREGPVKKIKVAVDRTIIYLKEEFELVRNKNGCLLFMSSVALGECKNPMQNKRITRIEVVTEGEEVAVLIYGSTAEPITVLRGRMDEVKIVLLTDLKKTSAMVTVGRKFSSGVKPKAPAINKEL